MTTPDVFATPARARPDGLRFVRAWAPLASAGLLTALAGPLLNHTLARAPEPGPALAGFWIGYSVLLLLEAACFVWQATSLAFLEDGRARRRLAFYALATGVLSSGLVALAGHAPVAAFLFRGIVPTSPAAAGIAGSVLRALVALPVLVAVRGVLAASVLRDGRGVAIPLALVVRLAVLAAWPARGGAIAACDALLAAAAGEVLVLALARATPGPTAGAMTPDVARVARVAAPLVVATLTWAALRPLLHALLGHLARPELAQARFGLAFAAFMTLGAPVWALQELAILAECRGERPAAIRAFARRVAAGASAALALLLVVAAVVAPMRAAMGFDGATGGFAWRAFAVLLALPFAVAWRAPSQGALIARHRTVAFARVPIARLGLTALAGTVAVTLWRDGDGATVGACLLVGGEWFEAWAYGRAASSARAEIPDLARADERRATLAEAA